MSFYCQKLTYQCDAAYYYAAIKDVPCSIWLDSGGMGRFDILTAAPHHTLETSGGDPFGLIRAELGEHLPAVENIPFAGGAAGYWRYDPAIEADGIAIYDWALVLDHREKTAKLVSHRRYPETETLLEQILQRLALAGDSDEKGEGRRGKGDVADNFSVQGKISSNFSKATYSVAFDKVQAYLQAGDCYQVNLAQRFSAAATGDAFPAYLELRKLSPAPFSAFLNIQGVQVLCASPERFVSVKNGKVETRPIKGTRPRDSNPEKDLQLADDLSCHPKDRAENLMIVDLLRNDLGKCCKAGSVRVPELFKVESYANVHHLVSTIQGELTEDRDALDVLAGCFPGGSITGAPKRRAMQIIEELEPDPREVYCGAIGYVGFDGNMDTNIVIRTLVYSAGEIHCWAGGGLVADSKCDAEYQETLDKASAMLKLLQMYGGKR